MFGKYLAWGLHALMPQDQAQRSAQAGGMADAREEALRLAFPCVAAGRSVRTVREERHIYEEDGKRRLFGGLSAPGASCPCPSPLREPEYGRAAPAGLRHLRREAFAQALIRSRCADLRHIPAEGRFFRTKLTNDRRKRPLKRGIVMEPLPGPDFLSFVAYAVYGA